jgi:L-iditol 2-dehydrogenase
MATEIATEIQISKDNLGVYTNPAHELWIASAEPSVQAVQTGHALEEGQVVIAIKSTGICGYVTSIAVSSVAYLR